MNTGFTCFDLLSIVGKLWYNVFLSYKLLVWQYFLSKNTNDSLWQDKQTINHLLVPYEDACKKKSMTLSHYSTFIDIWLFTPLGLSVSVINIDLLGF